MQRKLRLAGQTSLEVLVLLIPAFLNRGPILFPDVLGYWRGGQVAIDKVMSLLVRDPANATQAETMFQNAHVVRSAFYSVFVFMSAALSLWVVVIIQALIIASMLHLLFSLVWPDHPRQFASLFIVVISAITTLSWTASTVMPDIFTPVGVLAMLMLVLFWPSLERVLRCLLLLAVTGSVVMHLSNLPIMAGLLIVAALVHWRNFRTDWPRYAAGALSVVAAIIAILGASLVAFKEVTLSPHAPIFLTARALDDGFGRLYLRDHCPQINLAMCAHLDRLDVPPEPFLFDEQRGVYQAVSPAEQARLRDEDKRFYIAAAREHPLVMVGALFRNTVVQLAYFPLKDYYIPSGLTYDSSGITVYPPASIDHEPVWQQILDAPIYLIVMLSLMAMGVMWRRGSLRPVDKKLFLLIVVAVGLNALVVGGLAMTAARYSGRVIWLLPMIVALLKAQPANMRQANR